MNIKIGTAQEAGYISGFTAKDIVQNPGILAEGWTYLLSGSTRVGILSPSGVVYKLQHRPEAHYNAIEALFCAMAWRLGGANTEYVYIPKASLWRFGTTEVLAMEFLEDGGRGPKDHHLAMEHFTTLGIGDRGSHNYAVLEDGRIAPFDFGYIHGVNW